MVKNSRDTIGCPNGLGAKLCWRSVALYRSAPSAVSQCSQYSSRAASCRLPRDWLSLSLSLSATATTYHLRKINNFYFTYPEYICITRRPCARKQKHTATTHHNCRYSVTSHISLQPNTHTHALLDNGAHAELHGYSTMTEVARNED